MKITKFPELRQTYSWDCGANVIQSVLAYYGIDVREGVIMKLAGTTKAGTPIKGILSVAKKYKLKSKSGRMAIEDVKKYLDKKIPVILMLQAWKDNKRIKWENDWADGHFVVAIGYDAKKIYFEDPSAIKRTYLTHREFSKRWHDVDVNGKKYVNWGLAVYGNKPKYDLRNIEHMD